MWTPLAKRPGASDAAHCLLTLAEHILIGCNDEVGVVLVVHLVEVRTEIGVERLARGRNEVRWRQSFRRSESTSQEKEAAALRE